ncbi:PRC-barrel domain protein [compost metagenome]|jgi:YlmC/YmxH family sporulation protein|uniref:Sporulation protein, YlmC/YmxH family n=1 Tax=Clostridium intestinale DSM 6191 TaxID=1121320 RepID=A0A1M5TTK7_9CLOT|nr:MULTISPECIES: YlmC/YmxH family sporulation protein [Clostridium]WRY53015.1 YlmC/YmxH family sporulation protein [Clostridium intestinale]SHH54039.1 sporulation protein, YlmC/YmxH family [Clostridium intestinale DSM 6191]
MNDNTIKTLSEIENFEIINVNDGEKYNYLSNNDIIVDGEGRLKFLIVNLSNSKFTFFGGNEYLEIPWDYVKKIGAKTIILDVEEENIKRARL